MLSRMTAEQPNDSLSVASHVEACLSEFHTSIDKSKHAALEIKRKLSPGSLLDELGRFRIWTANIGAHRRGHSSLDYRLREASHIRNRVIELLETLEKALQDMITIFTGERVSCEDLSDSDSDESGYDARDEEDNTVTELSQLVSGISEITTCLMRLSMSIRNPAPHDQFKQSANISMAHFEVFDVNHVRNKFPDAEEFLVARLGKAISRKRQYLRYREEHRKRLGQDMHEHVDSGPYIKAPSTLASSIPTAFKSGGFSTIHDETDYYEDGLSQTSYASSSQGTVRLRPPPIPHEGRDGEPFECPLCLRITAVRNALAWQKHVYRDLQPYVCTFSECNTPDQTYESRNSWFNHELQFHRKKWECIAGCNLIFESFDVFRGHFRTAHLDLEKPEGTGDLLDLGKQTHVTEKGIICELCKANLPSLTHLRRHLGKHQMELSLFALPSSLEDGEESGDNVSDRDKQDDKETGADEDTQSEGYEDDYEEDDVVEEKLGKGDFGSIERIFIDPNKMAPTETRSVAEDLRRAEAPANEENVAEVNSSDVSKPPIKFKDAIGRKYSLPWDICKTWKGMEELINQAFLHVDVIGDFVRQGHYNLVGPDGEVIPLQNWEAIVQPDWAITMHMWPTSISNTGTNLEAPFDSTSFISAYHSSEGRATPDPATDVLSCSLCDTIFTGSNRRGNLVRHRRVAHRAQRVFTCGIDGCQKTYRRTDALASHKRSKHPIGSPSYFTVPGASNETKDTAASSSTTSQQPGDTNLSSTFALQEPAHTVVDNVLKPKVDVSKERSPLRASTDGEIRLRVDTRAPTSLFLDGDLEGRRLQLMPADESGMAELLISARDTEVSEGSSKPHDHPKEVSEGKSRRL